MSPHNLRIWGLIQAQLIRAEDLKAENARAIFEQRTPPSWGYEFTRIADEIERLANSFEETPCPIPM